VKITANLSKGILTVDGLTYSISNKIRTLKDGTRTSNEVIYSIPDNLPYDPQPFPKGLWNITGLDWQKEKKFDLDTYGPVKIRTDARQWVNVWELDGDGDYKKETSQKVMDHGYLLHYSKSSTTLGCIRINSPENAEALATLIQQRMGSGERVELEVV